MRTRPFTLAFLSAALVLTLVLSGCGIQQYKGNKIIASADTTPEMIVESFYRWYMDYDGNPLSNGAYRSSEHLNETLVQRVDGISASFDKGGYDPFLCAQDIPGAFSVGQATLSGDTAAVKLTEIWNPGTEYESTTGVEVILQSEGGSWKITDIDCSGPAVTEPVVTSPQQIVERFYNWYLGYIREPSSEEMRNPLSERAYRSSELLTEAFIQQLDEIATTQGYFPYDPFLCAQDIPQSFTVDGSELAGPSAKVTVSTSFTDHGFTVELAQVNSEWKIANVACRNGSSDPTEAFSPMPEGPVIATPEGTIDAFYSWYLWYLREVGNPLVDGAYRSSEYLSEGLVQKADGIIGAFDKGGYDPFLCAQDIPESFSVADAVVSGDIARSVVHTSFPGHGFTIALERREGRWELTDILCEFEQSDEVDAGAASTHVEGWQVFVDSQYGFQLQFPADWVTQEVELRYPELDAPTVRIVQFLPQEWAQQMNPGGPPDPNSNIVAPLSVEVSLGTLEAYQAKYVTPASSETMEINGYSVIQEKEVAGDFGMVRYLFQHPTRTDLRITLVDQISGFSTRIEGNQDIAEILQQMMSTFTFTGQN